MKARAPYLRILLVVALLGLAAPAAAAEPGDLLERVIRVLERDFYDRPFRRGRLEALADRSRPAARSADSAAREREVVRDFLGEIPTSHLALISRDSYEAMMDELRNRAHPTFGFGLVELDGRYFVSGLLEGGAAERAGLLRGDRVVRVDGVPARSSERLDWPTDDAALPDPPAHRLRCSEGEVVTLVIEREPGRLYRIRVRSELDSGIRAAARSASVFERAGRRIGYIHFWYMHYRGPAELLRDRLEDRFADCDALVLDLRGRGGSTETVDAILTELVRSRRSFGGPVVALIDRGTRSAKEILAHELRERRLATLVGERTAGAVIPATFRDVGSGAVLMFPAFSLGRYTEKLEGRGVAPDVLVRDSLPYARGADPILEAALDLLARPRDRRSL